MHKSSTNSKTSRDVRKRFLSSKWELIPYFSAVAAVGGISGCSGLSAYLQYNENRIKGCMDVPVYTGPPPLPTEAADSEKEPCLPMLADEVASIP
jgi:hypothetical protein